MIETTYLLLVLGILAIVFLIDAAMLYVAAHILKFKETGFRKALLVTGANWSVSLLITMIAATAYLYFAMEGGEALSTLSLVSLILSFAAFIYLIKHFYNQDWNDTILAFLIVIGVQVLVTVLFSFVLLAPMIFWQLGGITDPGLQTTEETTLGPSGWEKILPVAPTVTYNENGVFELTYVNAVSRPMTIENVMITDTNTSRTCTNIKIKGIDYSQEMIPAGGALELTAKCPEKNPGETYELDVKIDYRAVIGRVNTRDREEGTITGIVTGTGTYTTDYAG